MTLHTISDRERALQEEVARLRGELAALRVQSGDPVEFLLNGARLKLSFQQIECEDCGSMSNHFRTVPLDQYAEELQGQWLALVPAENDRHLRMIAPPAAELDQDSALEELAAIGQTLAPEEYASPPTPTSEPVAWAVFAPNGRIRLWSRESGIAKRFAGKQGLPLTPLYAATPVVSLPQEPPAGLLMSMALRFDHGLGCGGYYDAICGDGEHQKRLESTLTVMRQLYEEVSGHGFYSLEQKGGAA